MNDMIYNAKHPEIEDEHPEIEEGEIFLGNSTEEDYQKIGWKTKRKANIAFDRSGNTIIGLFPVFIQKREYDGSRRMYKEQ